MLNYISQDRKERQRYLSRKMAIMDMKSAISTAREEGEQKGRLEGKLEGKLEGITVGRTEGETLALQRLLTHRFGELPSWATEKLRNASAAQIESWLEKVLDAPDLDAFFK